MSRCEIQLGESLIVNSHDIRFDRISNLAELVATDCNIRKVRFLIRTYLILPSQLILFCSFPLFILTIELGPMLHLPIKQSNRLNVVVMIYMSPLAINSLFYRIAACGFCRQNQMSNNAASAILSYTMTCHINIYIHIKPIRHCRKQ